MSKQNKTPEHGGSGRYVQRRIRRLLDFPEPPPQMDVSDPRWPDAFSEWCQRKAEWYGMDAMEMMARALGLKKPADQWRERRAEERRKQQQRLEDMAKSNGIYYGKT